MSEATLGYKKEHAQSETWMSPKKFTTLLVRRIELTSGEVDLVLGKRFDSGLVKVFLSLKNKTQTLGLRMAQG